jgi:hypothetical protein
VLFECEKRQISSAYDARIGAPVIRENNRVIFHNLLEIVHYVFHKINVSDLTVIDAVTYHSEGTMYSLIPVIIGSSCM